MRQRIPLWLTLVPLVVAGLVWFWLWSGYEARFVADVQRALPGATIRSGGFPYRLEATVKPLAATHAGDALTAGVRAGEMRVNRVPWEADRQVLSFADVAAEVEVPPLPGIGLAVQAPGARASLHLDGRRIVRLSMVWADARIRAGFLAGEAVARSFEAHLREIDAVAPMPASSPRPPMQAELVFAAEGLEWRGGDPLGLDASVALTARGPLRGYAAWADGGTAEIEELRLRDAGGEVASVRATLVPADGGRLRIAGTIDTVCPATFRAFAAGAAPPPEKRARKPVRIAFDGWLPGSIALAPADPSRPPPPVRGQEAPCPRIRGA
jgi:hypothetical protein